MNHSRVQRIGFGVAGALGLLLMGATAFSQEKGKDKEAPKEERREGPKYRSLVRAGYTRPGSPQDKVGKNGQIIPLAHDLDFDGTLIGATVYFAVFKGTGADEDVFGAELAPFAEVFVEGRSFENTISPQFDRKAKYLYLYQVVNDRGLDPGKDGIRPAFDGDLATTPISSFALRLIVDPRYITSWGHFRNVSFAANVADRKVGKGGVIGAGDGKEILPMAFSANPAVLSLLPSKRYVDGSPAHGLGDLLANFSLATSALNLKKSAAYNVLNTKKGKEKLVNWEENEMVAAEGALEPDFVQVVFDSLREGREPTLEERHIGPILFRVDFKKNNLVKVGQHSVVFGFTSDLPPTDEPIRVAALQAKAKADGAAEGAGAAVGTAPTPIADVEPFAGGLPALDLGGYVGVGGGFGGGFGFPGWGGGFGVARPAGAFGGGGGNGDGEGGSEQNQNQQPNFNATLTNQQQQQQQQKQKQEQTNNGCCCCTDPNVVPEPSTILLGMLGLPALYFFRRRGSRETA